MVIVNLTDGLGNQFFQYAMGRFLARKLNTELKLDLTESKVSSKRKRHDYYRLGDFNIHEKIATPEEIARVKATGVIPPPLNLVDGQRDVYIRGHWFHGEEAFSEVADVLKKEFTLKNPLHKTSAAWKKKIRNAKNSVALHIRHGDYLKGHVIHVAGAIPLAYYKTCIEQLKKTFPDITVFVFSDNLDWARENLKLDVPTEFVEGCETDNEEFYLMSLCKHTIIANSTFSWWAAYLNPNPKKMVFAPDPWTRSGLWTNGISASWIKIPVDYENVPVDCPPLLSIIVHVHNNLANLNLLLLGLFNQTFRDYELIIIDDASTDGSEHFCRQVAPNKKITFLQTGRELGKAAAWNRGLDCARGEYVMFLSGDDLVMPPATHMLCQIYSIKDANLIFSVQYLEENPYGNVKIGDIPNKRFAQRVDEQFRNLNAPFQFNSGDLYQKLMMTGTRAFNSLLGTKFFRRNFLEKINLRFNEDVKNNFELLFLVNAVMQSEEITFFPGIFYVAPRK